MKLTKEYLRKVIKEELESISEEEQGQDSSAEQGGATDDDHCWLGRSMDGEGG